MRQILVVFLVSALALYGSNLQAQAGEQAGDGPVRRAKPLRSEIAGGRVARQDRRLSTPDGSSSAPQSSIAMQWYSLGSGGALSVNSSSHRAGLSIGESVVGSASSNTFHTSFGFWFGDSPILCLIVIPGDVNISGAVTSADVIGLVNFVFKGMAAPQPCEANGDVNCSGAVTSADIIYLVNYVFKDQAPPCDICHHPAALPCT